MKKFEDMTPQRQAAHEFFDKVLDLRTDMLRAVLGSARQSAIAKLMASADEHDELLHGAQEVVVISELIDEAVAKALSAKAMDANQSPKLVIVGSNPTVDTKDNDAAR